MPLVRRSIRVFLLVAILPAAAQAVDLKLERVLPESGEFRFTRKTSDELNELPIDVRRESVETAATPRYQVWADLDDVRHLIKYDYFRYILYVRDKTARSNAPITQFTFSGKGVGTFEDQIATVDFFVGDESLWEQGKIDLPVFGARALDSLSGPKYEADKPAEVYLASETPIALAIRNDLKKTPVEIRGVRSVSPRDPGMWELAGAQGPGTATFAPFELAPGATANENLVLRVKPKTAQAFASALVPRARKKADDVITVSVDYATQGRSPQVLSMQVPVQFVPWPPTLLLVTTAGAFLGWLLPVTENARRRRWRDRLRDLAAGAAAGLLVEIIAMLLVAADSEFRILGFRLDPFQMLPAALIGILSGMTGSQTLKMIRKAQWWAPPSAGADHA